MAEGITVIGKPFLAGTSRRIRFTIKNPDTGLGFQPDTLTLSVYDVDFEVTPAVESIVNDRNDINVLSACDADGNVDVELTPDDTAVEIPTDRSPAEHKRSVLFRWTWDDPVKVGKHQIVLTIVPDREPEAA